MHKIEANLDLLRTTKPLVLCLTNYVTMTAVANCLLSVGAAPIMSESIEEIEELVKISQAIYINIGTINDDFMQRVRLACKFAKQYNKVVVLDPVGAGASKIRTEATKEILPFVKIIRGNASEILAIFGECQKTLGVESIHEVSDAIFAAKELAIAKNITVMISGADDFVTDGSNENFSSFGSSLMPLVTGMGCRLTAVIAAFAAINLNAYEASYQAGIYFSLAGQVAEIASKAPGSFEVAFIDQLYQPDIEKMRMLYEGK